MRIELGRRAILQAAMASAATPARAADAAINIDNFAFAPAELSVPAGTRVTWTNRDDIPHVVVDATDARRMRSPPLDTGDRFAFVFATPGTYSYYCSLHPHMQGRIRVA